MDDDKELDNGSDSDAESVCSTVSASSSASVTSSAEKAKFRATFPPSITTKQLYSHFTHCGYDETEVQIHRHSNSTTGKPGGSATIVVMSQAEHFISLVNDTLLLNKHKLKVKPYHRRQRPKQSRKMVTEEEQMVKHGAAPCKSGLGMASPHLSSSSSEFCRIFVGSGLPVYINEQHIREHFHEFGSGIVRVDTIKDKETKKPRGYFFITFHSQAIADMAIQRLNHSFLLGMHKIKVEKQRVAQPQQSTILQSPVDLASRTRHSNKPSKVDAGAPTLAVENLDSAISVDEIKALVGVPVVEIINTESHSQRRYFRFDSDHDTSIAQTCLDGKTFLGKVVRVVEQKPHFSNPSSTHSDNLQSPAHPSPGQTVPLHRGYHGPGDHIVPSTLSQYPQHHHPVVQPPLLATLPVGHPPQYPAHHSPPDLQYKQPLRDTCQPHNQPLMSYEHQQGRESATREGIQLLKLQPDQWNQLMTMQSSGMSLYQEIVSPFQTNPHVKIDIIADSCTLKISGVPAAVSSAIEHIQHHMSKDLHIADRTKMNALLEIFPTLPRDISVKYGVTMSGFNGDSTVIHFDGPAASKTCAWTEINNLISSAMISCVDFRFPIDLISSLRKCLQSENVPTYIRPYRMDAGLSQVIVCSFDKAKHEQAVKRVQGGPFVSKVSASPSDVEELVGSQDIKSVEEEFLVSVQSEDENSTLVVLGFCQNDVQIVCKKVINLLKELSERRCSQKLVPEQVMYLKFQHQNSPHLFSDIPVEFKKGKTVEISANPKTIQRIISGPLLAGLQWKRYHFKCNSRFQQQITTRILRPLKEQNLNFVYLVDKHSPNSGTNRMQGKQNYSAEQFDVVVYSQDPTSFCQVCASLDDIKPMSKRYNFRYRESLECVRSIKNKLENDYLVQINETERGAYVNGLKADDVQKCWDDIDETIKSAVVMTKTIPCTIQESKYLEQKHFEKLKLEFPCEIFVNKGRGELRAKGKLKDIEGLQSRISEILESGVHTEMFTLSCNARHFSMWKKWWIDHMRQRKDSEIILNFFRKDKRQSGRSESEQMAEVQFEIIGTDGEQLLGIKQVLCSQETEDRIVDVSAAGATALLSAKQQGLLKFVDKLAVMVFIDKKANKVILTAPQGLADDLDTAEQEIQKFVGNHASTHKNLTSDDPVVGLVLCSKTRCAPYLASANSIAKSHKVSVHPLRTPQIGLRLSGSPAAIGKVESFIRSNVLKVIEGDVKQDQLTVKHKQSCLLSSTEFSRFESKLKEDYCVLCSYPKHAKQNKAVLSAMIQASLFDHPLQVDLCHGSIVHEKVDAIVNPANEDLQHVGGLAKVILDAAGVAIQVESNMYIQKNGRIPPGGCVALSAGTLPCKRIIHAVGPRWVDGTKGEEKTLYLTVLGSLQCADNEKLDSVAFPAISTGIFQVPDGVCARASLKAVRDYSQTFPNSTVTTVRFVLFTPTAFQSFSSHFKSIILPCALPAASPPKAVVMDNPIVDSQSTYQWLWADDKGSFTPYPPDVIARCNKEYQQNPQGSFHCLINKNIYIIDFANMTQTNIRTSYKRSIRKESYLSTQTVHWEYANDQGSWSPYQPHESQIIEAKHQANIPCSIQIHGNTYKVDFLRMFQINVQTNHKRNVRRVVPTSGISVSRPVQKPSPRLDDAKPINEDITVVLRGPRDSLPQAKRKLEEKLKSLFKSHSVAFPAALQSKLCKIIRKYNVSSTIEDVTKGGQRKPQKMLKIEGLSSSVDRAVSAIQEEIIQSQLNSEEDQEEYPKEWEQQSTTTQLFPVKQGNMEWSRVEALFKQTMPSSTVFQISRIQNRWLWDRYVFQRKRLGIKNNGKVNELELFHGTRTNDPKVIYAGEEGFDMRYSAQGMWGQANYFAVNASYSHGYAHSMPDGCRQMFLVKVLTGDSYESPSDRSLRKPPMKSTHGSSEVSFSQMQYDTVTGITAGSRVYMTYDNDKAYPAYLIKYT